MLSDALEHRHVVRGLNNGDGVELVGQGLKSFGDYGRLASTIKDGGNLAMNDGMVHRGFNRSPFQQWTWPCICSAT